MNAILTPGLLRAYLRQRDGASLTELVARFSVPASMVEGILAYWQRRGNIETQNATSENEAAEKTAPACAGGCRGCPSISSLCADFSPAVVRAPVFHWKEQP